MTCSINHANLTTKFCSVCGAPAIQQQQQYQQPPQQYMPPQQQYQQAMYGQPLPTINDYYVVSPGKRIGALALDILFFFVTCQIGWLIWALIVAGNAQSPGKQVLNLRVYGTVLGTRATWGHTAIRTILIPLTLWISSYIFLIFFAAVDSTGVSTLILLFLILAGIAGVYLGVLFSGSKNQSFADKWAKSVVLDETMPRY